MKPGRFTDKKVVNLKPAEKRYDVRESSGGGFGIRVSPNGTKSWFFIYTFEGRKCRLSLGTYPAVSLQDARIKHADAVKLLQKGVNPGEEKRAAQRERVEAPTIKHLIEDFLEHHVVGLADQTRREYRRCLERYVLPEWGKRKVKDIRRRDVHYLLQPIKSKAPAQANAVFRIMRKLFNYAVQHESIEISPCLNVSMPAAVVRKDRWLSAEEVQAFWSSLPDCPISDEIQRALKLILVTGQRPGEVIGAHSREIKGDWWIIPGSRTKNSKEQRVYLTRLAKDLIGDKDGYIFESPRGGKHIEVNAISLALRRGFANKTMDLEHFTPHELRRTASTHMAQLGFTDEVIAAILNHTRTGVTAIYNRFGYDAYKQLALCTWSWFLEQIVAGWDEKTLLAWLKDEDFENFPAIGAFSHLRQPGEKVTPLRR
jgi:integrase